MDTMTRLAAIRSQIEALAGEPEGVDITTELDAAIDAIAAAEMCIENARHDRRWGVFGKPEMEWRV